METEVTVSRQYLTADNFTDVIPRITVYTSEGHLLGECVDEETDCTVTIDERDLKSLNTYTVTASVLASDVTCVKSITVYYRG